jgi:hypothetical protein
MTRVGGVAVAIVLAAALAGIDCALADPAEDGQDAAHFLIFSGADLWRQGNFLYGGTVWAPFALDADGPVVKLITTRGFYRYRSGTLGNADVIGTMNAVAVMPGVHFTRSGVTVTVYAGLDRQSHALAPDDPGNAARGTHLGVRGAAELWVEPTSRTMVTGALTMTTIASAYALRAAAGWRLFDKVYLGPQAQFFGADNYRQWRLGLHLTGVTLLKFELQAGLGYASDDNGNGLFVQLGVTRKH